MKKTVIIFEHQGGRLGNQLWNYASVVAYCLERGYECQNMTFDEYAGYFMNPAVRDSSHSLRRLIPGRLVRKLLQIKQKSIKNYHSTEIISSGDHLGVDAQKPFYLPPSPNKNEMQARDLVRVESSSSPTIYMSGWLFRNPDGMMKYQHELAAYFRPNEAIARSSSSTIEKLRSQYKHIIGVHIRKRDYKQYWSGRFYFTEQEIRPMLEDFLERSNINKQDAVFVICSDESIDSSAFSDLNVHLNNGSIGEDLFTLSKCDFIIGSDSTFGAIAAYLGNIPIILFSKDQIDWSIAHNKGYNYYNGSLNIQP